MMVLENRDWALGVNKNVIEAGSPAAIDFNFEKKGHKIDKNYLLKLAKLERVLISIFFHFLDIHTSMMRPLLADEFDKIQPCHWKSYPKYSTIRVSWKLEKETCRFSDKPFFIVLWLKNRLYHTLSACQFNDSRAHRLNHSTIKLRSALCA